METSHIMTMSYIYVECRELRAVIPSNNDKSQNKHAKNAAHQTVGDTEKLKSIKSQKWKAILIFSIKDRENHVLI